MKKTQIGTVISDKMQNTAIIEVAIWKKHSVLKKRYQRHHKFMAENPEDSYKVGDVVEITETRPLSRNKRWEITKKIDFKAAEVKKKTVKSVKSKVSKKK